MYPFEQMFGKNYSQSPQFYPIQFQIKQVSSIEEARAFIVDPVFTYLFVDIGTGRIYMKKMGGMGLSEFYIYEINENPTQPKSPLDELKDKINFLEKQLQELKDAKSISINDEHNTKPGKSNTGTNDTKNEKPKSTDVPKSTGNDGGQK